MDRIKELRLQNGWRQIDLAERLHAKQQTIGHYETGERGLDANTILKLCDIFGVSADYLLGRTDSKGGELSSQDAAMLHAFRSAPPTVQTAITVLLSPYIQNAEDASGKTDSRAV